MHASERYKRVFIADNKAVIDGALFFVRARLNVPIRGTELPLTWHVWVRLERDGFLACMNGTLQEQPAGADGVLANNIPGYDRCHALRASVHETVDEPCLWLKLQECDHQLARDARHGMPPTRARGLLEFLLEKRVPE
jgi:hypothetical protein